MFPWFGANAGQSLAKVRCIKYSESCYACSDGLNRVSPVLDFRDKSKAIISDAKCARHQQGQSRAAPSSVTFVLFARMARFHYCHREKKMKVDLYECLTEPRTFQYAPNR